MKVQAISITRMFGKAKSGNDYDMHRLTILTTFEPFNNETTHREGNGLTTMEIPVLPEVYPSILAHFKANFKGTPIYLELQTLVQARGRNVETVIAGFKAI